jgi:hypothetical protein
VRRLAAILRLAACGDAPTLAPPLPDAGAPTVAVTAPTGLTPLVPGHPITITTRVDLAGADPSTAHLAVTLDASLGGADQVVFDGAATAGDTSRTFPADDQPFPAPGVYALTAALDAGDAHVTAPPSVTRVAAQGVVFRRPAPGERVEVGAPVDLALDAVTLGPMALTLVLAAENGTAGDEVAIITASIPGELVPVPRTYSFDGTDATGAPVPAGDYRLEADIVDQRTGAAYRSHGGSVRVTR